MLKVKKINENIHFRRLRCSRSLRGAAAAAGFVLNFNDDRARRPKMRWSYNNLKTGDVVEFFYECGLQCCWQLLFNFCPQLMFDIFKVLEQNLGCGCENSIRYWRACSPHRASHVICIKLPGFYRFLTKNVFNITPKHIIPFESLCFKVTSTIFFIFVSHL